MKMKVMRCSRWFIAVCVAMLTSMPLFAETTQVTRTQTFELVPGWNAVWIDILPNTAHLNTLMADYPIDIVAKYARSATSSQFVSDPTINMNALMGWNVWFSPRREDHILSRLVLIMEGGYLIHALEACTLSITGMDRSSPIKWEPHVFNLAGFQLEKGAPTFKEFFAGSKAHNHNKIYRLVKGRWNQVLQPELEAMRSGEAFWIYSEGRSDYRGPLMVKTDSTAGLFLSKTRSGDLKLRNDSNYPIVPTVSFIPMQGDPAETILKLLVSSGEGFSLSSIPVVYDEVAWTQNIPPMEPGASLALTFALSDTMNSKKGDFAALVKVSTDVGSITYVPVMVNCE